MNIKELRLKNFRGYGENPNDKEGLYKFGNLDKDIVILSGFNGFGKTSFVEAIEWCLTDNIKRLKVIEEEVYDVRELRKSHYLKFYQPENQDQGNRQIFVELSFSNGLRVQRTSLSNHPRTSTDKDTYESNLQIYMGDELVTVNTEEQLLSYFSKDKLSTDFLNTHILGQESMNSFIRSNNPSERRSRFLQLLNLTQLEDLYQKTNKIKNRSFSTKKKEVKEQINILEKKLGGINTFLSILNFGDMQQYIDALNAENLKLQLIINESTGDKRSDLSLFQVIKIDTCVSFLEQVEQTKNKLISEKTIFEKKLEDALLLKESIGKIIILNRGLSLMQRVEQAEILKQTDYAHVTLQESLINNNIERILELEVGLKGQISLLEDYVDMFEGLHNLKLDSESIEVSFWELLSKQSEKYVRFVNSYKTEELELNSDLINSHLLDMAKLKSVYEVHASHLTTVKHNLTNKQIELSSISKINSLYMEVLDNVKNYLLANPDTQECPVCLNSNFIGDSYSHILEQEISASVTEKLLTIIKHTVSAGNERVGEVSNQTTDIKNEEIKVIKQIQDEIVSKIIKTHKSLTTLFKKQYERVNAYYQGLASNVRKEIDDQQKLLKTLKGKKLRYDECLRYVFEDKILLQGKMSIEDVTLEEINNILASLDKQLEEWNTEVLEGQFFSYKPSMFDISNFIKVLEEKEGIGLYYPDNINGLGNLISTLQNSINHCIRFLNATDAVLVYKIPQDYTDKFADYTNLEKGISEFRLELEKVEQYERAVKQLNSNISSEQQYIIETKLKRHPIIRYIYEAITPHPFYKELIISSDKNGANFKNESEEIYLDLLFSSAQLNILALSVFLGLGLTQNHSQFNQLLLDDPIQSMDDVNILAFIDILRGIIDMETRDKKILISTHDSNFAQLLTIKLRNKEYVHYKFTGYGNEGPIVSLLTNSKN